MAAVALGALLSVLSGSTLQSACLHAPVSAPITRHFVEPSCPYCAGHRTVDFSARVGAEVRAPVTGTVTFVGTVAGSRYITITRSQSANSSGASDRGMLVTIGGAEPDAGIDTGARVDAGERIATATADPIRLSMRRLAAGGPATYLNPEPALARWRAPVRLVAEPGAIGANRRVPRSWSCRTPVDG